MAIELIRRRQAVSTTPARRMILAACGAQACIAACPITSAFALDLHQWLLR
jgi:hypothetical protein